MTLNLHGSLPEESLTTYDHATHHAHEPQTAPRTHSLARITSTLIINVAKMRFWETDTDLIDSVKEP